MKNKLLKTHFKTVSFILGLSVFVLLSGFDAHAQVFNNTENKQAAAPTRPTWKQNGNVNIKKVENKTSEHNEEEIMLFMSNFRISTGLSGQISCSMKFHVYNNLKNKISNISYRLKWPDMETPLSFEDVEPGQALHRSYALLGKGCYSMDKSPNVIVNRCRVKGISQEQCASYISWKK